MALKASRKLMAVGAGTALVAASLVTANSAQAAQEFAWSTVRACVSQSNPPGTFVSVQFSGYDSYGNWVKTKELSATTRVAGDCISVEQFRWQVDRRIRIFYHIGRKSRDVPCYINTHSRPVTCTLDYGH